MIKVLIVASFATLTLASCGGKMSPCDCNKMLTEMMGEYMSATDEAASAKIEEKYKSKIEACEKTSKDMGEEEFGKAMLECK